MARCNAAGPFEMYDVAPDTEFGIQEEKLAGLSKPKEAAGSQSTGTVSSATGVPVEAEGGSQAGTTTTTGAQVAVAQPEKAADSTADSVDERLKKAVENDVNVQFAEMQLFQGNWDKDFQDSDCKSGVWGSQASRCLGC